MILKKQLPQQCDYCGKIAELRPYGKNGACICFECGMKNEREVRKNFALEMGMPQELAEKFADNPEVTEDIKKFIKEEFDMDISNEGQE